MDIRSERTPLSDEEKPPLPPAADEGTLPEMPSESDPESGETSSSEKPQAAAAADFNWDADPHNPYNWPKWKKVIQVIMISAAAFTASIGSSIVSSSHEQFMQEFGVTSTQAILPLSTYVFALGVGPAIASPLSETFGRYPVFLLSMPIGLLFTVGAGLTHSFAALCILRFLAGLCMSPSLAISSGTINEVFHPPARGPPSIIFILMPFLGPGLGPVIGSFVAVRKGWRWTQYTLIFFGIFAILTSLVAEESFHPVLKARRMKKLGLPVPPKPPTATRLKAFVTIALLRPIHMLFTEPIVALICLYVSCEFATLFSFFAAVPYTFRKLYNFTLEEQGLVFLSITVGCLLGSVTMLLCNIFLYLPATKKFPPHKTPPEYRLYPAMIGSLGLPIGLFWFAWTAKSSISWASPVVAIMPFAWGNLCLFISTIQYLVDTYQGTTVASAAGANSLARYALAGGFPLFTIQMYERLGIDWATSLYGFIALALLPVPWAFFKFGKQIRAKSRYPTTPY